VSDFRRRSDAARSGLLAFLVVYALRFTGRLQTSTVTNAVVILLLALGVGALWEIAAYVADLAFQEGSQGSPAMTPLDDTMWDLILDGVGGALGGLVDSLYMRLSKRTARRIVAFAQLGRGARRCAGVGVSPP
jgi:hypothetical protein